MVQIAEYTRREGVNYASAGGMNISLPDAITNRKSGDAFGKKILETSGELGKVFLDMKERRDEGIVSGFVNQFDIDSTSKITELTNKYKGQDAQKIMPEYQKWRDDYISKYSSYNKSEAEQGRVYIENESQKKMAMQKLDSYNVKDINTISSYIAKEEEAFRVNNLNTSIANNSEKIASEQFVENIDILKSNMYSDVSNLYRGQSSEFVNEVYGKLINDAIYSNIMRDSSANPIASISRFQDENLRKDLDSETLKKAQADLEKSFISYQALQIANAQTGRQSSPAGEEFYKANRGFFGNREGEIKQAIEDKAIELRNGILEKDERNNRAVINDLSVQLINARNMAELATDEQDKRKYVAIEAGVLSALTGVRGGVETAKMIDSVYTEIDDYNWLLRVNDKYNEGKQPWFEDGKVVGSQQEVQQKLDEYRKRLLTGQERINGVLSEINQGKYETILDVPDFESFTPYQKKEILKSFADNSRYRSLLETAKDKSNIDFESKIDSIYKFERGEKYKHPVMYNMFKQEMATQIVKWLSSNPNKIPTSKDLQLMANNSLQSKEVKTVDEQINKIISGVEFESSDIRDYTSIKKMLVEKIKGETSAWWHNKEEEKAIDRAADYIIDNDKISAYNILKEAGLFD